VRAARKSRATFRAERRRILPAGMGRPQGLIEIADTGAILEAVIRTPNAS